MFKDEDIIRIKSTYQNLSELERTGIFQPEVSKQERDVANFIGNLDSVQSADLFLYLHTLEQEIDEGKDLSSRKTDMSRLKSNGINLEDKDISSLTYGLLSKKLDKDKNSKNSRNKELSSIARIKATARSKQSEDIRDIVKPSRLKGEGLHDFVEKEIRKVEKYLTNYFTAIAPVLSELLPMEFEVDGKNFRIEEDCSRSFSLDRNKISNLLIPRNRFGRTFIDKYGGIILRDIRNKESIYMCDFSSVNLEAPLYKIGPVAIDGRISNSAQFGTTIPLQGLKVIEDGYKEVNRELTLAKKNWFSGGIKYSKSGEKIKKLLLSKGDSFLVENLSDSELNLFSFDKEKLYSISSRFNQDFSKVNLRCIYKTEKIIKSNLEEEIQPLFVFTKLNVESYDLKTQANFWKDLQQHAKIPLYLTKEINGVFKENYIDDLPVIDIEAEANKVKEEMQILQKAIGSGVSKGYLNVGDKKLLDSGK